MLDGLKKKTQEKKQRRIGKYVMVEWYNSEAKQSESVLLSFLNALFFAINYSMKAFRFKFY